MHPLARLKQVHLGPAVRLVWQSARLWTAINLGLVILQGLLPLASLYVMKRVVDAVSAGVTASDRSLVISNVLHWVILAGLLALLSALARSLAELSGEAQSLVVTDAVSDILHAKSIAVDLAYYEDPAYYDTLHRAQQEAPYRPTRILNGLVSMIQNSISLVGIAGLLISFNWIVGLILFLVALPGAWVRLWHSRRLYQFEMKQAEKERKAWYYNWILTGSDYARELRLFHLGDLFLSRFKELRGQLREGRLALSRKRSTSDFLVQALAALAVFGTLGFAAYQTVAGTVSLGSLVVYYLGFQSGLTYLQAILRSLTGLYEDNLFLNHFYQFLNMDVEITAPANPLPVPDPFACTVRFENVSFAYPGRPQAALQKVNLELRPGEVIALVGENGAGKTTLIKLLSRLYDPLDGNIAVDGISLYQLDPVQWRRQISVVFQDYAHYHLKAWENIWLGNSEQPPNQDRIQEAARRSGADEVIRKLPNGYDHSLGNWFDDGLELSTGQWQKIAIARAFYRDARIVVLDEPTSSLDPLAEAELFRRFRTLIQGRSAILISHRFSTVQMADRIYVLDCGQVVEQGTHDELIRMNGKYAHLYNAQAQYYQQAKEETAR